MFDIGIDLGTSAVKLLLVNETGAVEKAVSREYPLYFPNPGWSEQNPADWWNAVQDGLKELVCGHEDEIGGMACAGQMHGLVALDAAGQVIRPAILWNDGRTAEETAWLNETVGKETLLARTGNIAFAGFTAPKLLWLRKHEPENFAKIAKIMLPKDYITYMLTGVFATDYSDAAGTLLLDVKNKRWSAGMTALCGLKETALPRLYESYEPVGALLPEIAAVFGLPAGVTVAAGAGDNAGAAIGTGTVKNGGCNLSVGTSGTVFIAADDFPAQLNPAIHAFAHANGRFHLMGCMLSAASCNKWLCDNILETADYAAEQAGITDDMLGNNHVFFLPYLMGERSPNNDVNARGTFTGITLYTARTDLVQAVLEGVAFAIRDSFEVAKSLGLPVGRSKLCGGGAKSPLWRKIFANVLGIPLEMVRTEQGPGYGAAMLAMVGSGVFESVEAASDALVEVSSVTEPDPALTARYEAQYQKYRKIYPALRDVFPALR